MILLEAGRTDDERGFDSKLLFAAALAERGHRVVIDEGTVPDGWTRHHKYDAAPYLAAPEDIAPAALLLIGAEDVTTADPRPAPCARPARGPSPRGPRLLPGPPGLGRGADKDRLRLRARAAGRRSGRPRGRAADGPRDRAAGRARPRRRAGGDEPVRLLVFLPAEWMDEPGVPPLLAALDAMPRYRLSVVTPSAGKERLRQTRYAALDVFGYADVPPDVLARRCDVAAFFGAGVPGERMAALAVDLVASGKAVIDGTAGAAFEAWGAPVLRGPEDPAALPAFLEHAVIPNLAAIGSAARESPWTRRRGIAALEAAAGLLPPPPAAAARPRARPHRLPAHERQRTRPRPALRPDRRAPRPAGARALPRLPELPASGPETRLQSLPLVQKSPDHPEEYANDLVNHLRLRRTLRPEDHLVFDGGYVFDSIYRTILETGCRATWIRRGLWRPGQVASPALDRERAFDRILVPEEAFPELNVDYSSGARVRRVGPVVQPPPEIAARRCAPGSPTGSASTSTRSSSRCSAAAWPPTARRSSTPSRGSSRRARAACISSSSGPRRASPPGSAPGPTPASCAARTRSR
jgi:hypothetical protein